MKTGIIGYGYWGINLVRNVVGNSVFDLKYVCDTSPDRLQLLQKTYPWLTGIDDANIILNDSEIECVIIATNPANHFSLAQQALKNRKHVLVEKPLATNLADAVKLAELAYTNGVCLMVDHTFLYHGAVRKIKEIAERGELGTINYIDSTRINLGIFQNDINVLWDLATHDLSIINYLTGELPYSVAATGKCHIKPGIENIAYLNLFYQTDLIAHIHSSWSSPVKVRQMLVGGDKKMLVYNDIEPSEKIKVYDSGFITDDNKKEQILVDYRTGDVFVPKHDTREALSTMVDDFAQSVKTGKKPLADANSAIQIIQILTAAKQSITQNGKEVKLSI
ncbi:MAG TPA: Gfo/Idh/MocA family oxidoreductase [Bacteroidales bacterium]|nr:Gfo/Idh/MocA family oxidoreductase [Bacteroidales bacterium]